MFLLFGCFDFGCGCACGCGACESGKLFAVFLVLDISWQTCLVFLDFFSRMYGVSFENPSSSRIDFARNTKLNFNIQHQIPDIAF